jgi:hypothetical protein
MRCRKSGSSFFKVFLLIPGSGEILFCLYSFILCGTLENDPLSPPKGEAAQGEHLFPGYNSALSGVIAIGGMPERRGRKHEMQKSSQERLFVFYEGCNKADFCK